MNKNLIPWRSAYGVLFVYSDKIGLTTSRDVSNLLLI